MRAAGSETGRQRASRTTSANQAYATTVLGDARAVSSVFMVPTPMEPMVFHKSTRDVKTRSAVKENTNETRDGGGSPGVRRPGDGLGLRSNIYQRGRGENKTQLSFQRFIKSILGNHYGPGVSSRARQGGRTHDLRSQTSLLTLSPFR